MPLVSRTRYDRTRRNWSLSTPRSRRRAALDRADAESDHEYAESVTRKDIVR